MKTYQGVLYDIDGTLLNTINMNMYPLIRIIKEELGEDWALKDVIKFMAYPGMKTMEELGIPNPQQVYQRWVRYVNEYEEGATPYEGVEQMLATLQAQGVRQAAVSSKNRAQYAWDWPQTRLSTWVIPPRTPRLQRLPEWISAMPNGTVWSRVGRTVLPMCCTPPVSCWSCLRAADFSIYV